MPYICTTVDKIASVACMPCSSVKGQFLEWQPSQDTSQALLSQHGLSASGVAILPHLSHHVVHISLFNQWLPAAQQSLSLGSLEYTICLPVIE